MSDKLRKAYACATEAAAYGATVAAALPPQASPLGLVVGGLVGCAKGAGLSFAEVGDEVRGAWRMTRRVVGRVLSFFGGGDDKSSAKPAPPLTTDEALALVAHSWSVKRSGPALYRQGKRRGEWYEIHKPERVLTSSVLADLYGPGGAVFDAERVLGLWWAMWEKSLKERPDWKDAQTRLFFCILRVGAFLQRAPKGASIASWPLLAEGDEAKEEARQIQAEQGTERGERVYHRSEPSEARKTLGRVQLGLDLAELLAELGG